MEIWTNACTESVSITLVITCNYEVNPEQSGISYANVYYNDADKPDCIPEQSDQLLATEKVYIHTVYPVTPNAGMFYQRGYKQ